MRKLIIIFIFIFSAYTFALPSFAGEDHWARINFHREADPVVVKGKLLHNFAGVRIEQLTLYSFHQGEAYNIPFQVDEKGPDGSFILTAGEDVWKDQDGGCLDANDELVFMAMDLGERASSGGYGEQSWECLEIEIMDPLTRQKGWAYLVADPFIVKSPSHDYVTYKFDHQRAWTITDFYVSSTDYTSNITDIMNLIQPDGDMGLDLLDRFKIRNCFKLHRYLLGLTFCFNEEDVDSSVTGYKDGPVRVIQRVKTSIKVLGMRISISTSDTLLYPHFYSAPRSISLPFNIKSIFTKLKITTFFDLNHLASGMLFFSSCNSQPFKVDGIMSPSEIQLERSNPRWMLVTGAQGTCILVVDFEPEFIKDTDFSLYYLDDMAEVDPPEGESGQMSSFGYEFDISNLSKGTYAFAIYTFAPDRYRPGDEINYLNMIEHPLQVTVRGNITEIE